MLKSLLSGEKMTGTLTVCIVGRPNVGKSTMFNKLTRTRDALVDNQAGVTRDRLFGQADLDGVLSYLIDTGGLEPVIEDEIVAQVREQALLAIEESDVICFAVDGRAGLTNIDHDIADKLRRSGKKTVIAVNKLDTYAKEAELAEFYALGFEHVFAISAEHSLGLGELAECLAEGYEKTPFDDDDEDREDEPVTIAIVGRPNVGKSSLINRIIGEDRMMVTDIPGTTRESVDSVVRWHEKDFILIDTAGMRKKARISQRLEKFSVIMALKAVARCKIALLVVDAERGITDQEIKIAGIIQEQAKACIILVNKWDLPDKDTLATDRFEKEIRDEMKFASYAPVLFVSAKTGQRLGRIFEEIDTVMKEFRKRVDTGPLNRHVIKWVSRQLPPVVNGKRAKFYYVAQTKSSPPIFNFSVNSPTRVLDHYKRYLVNKIRAEYGFAGSPVVCRFLSKRGSK